MKAFAFATALALLVTACGGAAAPSATPAQSAASAAASVAASATQAPRVSLKFNWTAVSGASSALWTAYEAGYFNDLNLDVTLVNIASSSNAMAALLSKEVQFSHMDGQVAIDGDIQGAGVKLVYGINNHLVFSIMTKKDITKPEDLKGKKLGITTIGSSTDTAARLALKMWNLKPDIDVPFIRLNEVPNIFTALAAGQVDAGVMSPPTNTRAKQAGFNELLNLGKDGPEWPSVAVGTTADYIKANPDVVRRVVMAYAKGAWRYKTDKAFGVSVLKKYLKLDDQAILEDTWTQYSGYLEEVPLVKGMQTTIDNYSQSKPEAKNLKPEDMVDNSIVQKLDSEGYFKKLYGK